MVILRTYDEKTDAQAVGILIAETYRKYNLDFASPAEQEKLLGPFRHAGSADPSHQEAITQVLRAEMVFVAEDYGEIVRNGWSFDGEGLKYQPMKKTLARRNQ